MATVNPTARTGRRRLGGCLVSAQLPAWAARKNVRQRVRRQEHSRNYLGGSRRSHDQLAESGAVLARVFQQRRLADSEMSVLASSSNCPA